MHTLFDTWETSNKVCYSFVYLESLEQAHECCSVKTDKRFAHHIQKGLDKNKELV